MNDPRPGSVRLRLLNIRLIFTHGWEVVGMKTKKSSRLALLGMSEAPSLLGRLCSRELLLLFPGPSAVLSWCLLEPLCPVGQVMAHVRDPFGAVACQCR